MATNSDQKNDSNVQDSELEDSLVDDNGSNIITDGGNDSEVINRFLVTKDKPLFAAGTTTKYLEVLYDGSVRIRDVKKSTYSDPIHKPWNVFRKDIQSKKDKNKHKNNEKEVDKNEKLKIYMDGKSKKRYFKFSTLSEKDTFFQLIEELRLKKDRKSKRQKYSTTPFQFAPYEVTGFFIRDSVVFRVGSQIKYKNKLIAITNYRIVVIDGDQERQNKLNRGDNIIPALTIPHHSVYDYNIDSNGEQIVIETKDYRTITINLANITNNTLRTQSLFMMKRYLLPNDEKDLFAFAGYFSVTRTKTPSHSEADLSKMNGFPDLKMHKVKVEINKDDNDGHNNSKSTTSIQSKKEEEDDLYVYTQLTDSRYSSSHAQDLMRSEFYRLGYRSSDKNCPFRICELNRNYSLCLTYPSLLLVPRAAKDLLIKKASSHRSRNRLPVITWSNSYNITISRSSQPQAGVSHKRNEYDERLLLLLNEMNTYSETFVICDCRPRVNAIANQYMKGKGFESGDNYEKAHIIFFDIQNIHEMRKSVNALKKCCENQFDSGWLQNLHETKWFQHITKVIQCSRRCANMVDRDKYSVLIHCSDGWDRTAQVAALSQLLLDPYYRTFIGFLLLIQKEWLWFGHKFSDRNANYPTKKSDSKKKDKNDNHLSKSNRKEISPIFLQFLDCTFQIMMQFPWAFEFTQDLLLEFSLHCSSGRFGDFFCNSMRDRMERKIWLKTPSLFKYLSALWKLGRFRNPDYIPTKTVLRPRYAVRDMILWDEVYCRFTMHDKDRHSSLSTISTINTISTSAYPPLHHGSISIQNTHGNGGSISIINAGHNHNSTLVNSILSVQPDSGASSAYNEMTAYGKNRYHPRSPRISTKFKKGISLNNDNSNTNDDDMDDGAPLTPRGQHKRSKPRPPPPKSKFNKLTTSDTNEIQNDNAICSYNSDDDNDKPFSIDHPHYDDDDDESDSDSVIIPEEVKRITLLQKKVRELETILKDYRNKENENNKNNNNNMMTQNGGNADSDDDENLDDQHLSNKGNIV